MNNDILRNNKTNKKKGSTNSTQCTDTDTRKN